jgi:hypothetical protein
VKKPTILVATWSDGLFAVTGDGRTQEIAKQPVRGLAPDGRGGALAIVGRHSLRRRAQGGEWAIVATSKFELSCCMAVGDATYVGTDASRATAGHSLGYGQFERDHTVRQRSRGRHSAFSGWRKNLATHHRYQLRCS